MQITIEWLKEKHACSDGTNWFSEHFPGGSGDYQAVLDALAQDNKVDYARWLLNAAGHNDSVLEVEGDLEVKCGVFFAGRINVSGKIFATAILAGAGIKAGDK